MNGCIGSPVSCPFGCEGGACNICNASDTSLCVSPYFNLSNACKVAMCNTTSSPNSCYEVDRICNDNNPCTDDSCDPETGCVYTWNSCCNISITMNSPSESSWQNKKFMQQYTINNITCLNFNNTCSYSICQDNYDCTSSSFTPITCETMVDVSVPGNCSAQGIDNCTVRLNVTRTYNNTGINFTSARRHLSIDYTSPNGLITFPPNNSVLDNVTYANGTASDSVSGINSSGVMLKLWNTTHCYNQSNQWVSGSCLEYQLTTAYSTGIWLRNGITGLSYGSYYNISAKITDTAGNFVNTTNTFLYYDFSKMPVTGFVSPAESSYQREPSFTINVLDNYGLGGFSQCWYNLSNDGDYIWEQTYRSRPCNSTFSITVGSGNDCDNEGASKCVIEVGMNNTYGFNDSKRRSFSIDYSSPSILINIPENNTAYSNISKVNGSVTDIYSGVTSFPKVLLKNASGNCYDFSSHNFKTSVCNDYYNVDSFVYPVFNSTLLNIPKGSYNITINATDNVGHTASVRHTFIIAPIPDVVVVSPSNMSWHNSSFTLNIDDTNWDNCYYKISNNSGSSFSSLTSRACDQPLTINTTMCGNQGYGVCVVQLSVNNTLYWINKTYNFSIDLSPPVVVISSPLNNSVNTNLTVVNGTAYDVAYKLFNTSNITIKLYNSTNCYNFGVGWVSGSNCPYVPVDSFSNTTNIWSKDISFVVFSHAQYNVSVNVTDVVSQSTLVRHDFTFVKAPNTTVLSPANLSWHNTNITMSIVDENADNCYYKVSGDGGSTWGDLTMRACNNPLTISVGAGKTCNNQGYGVCVVQLSVSNPLYFITKTYNFSIDYTNPNINITQPVNNSNLETFPQITGTARNMEYDLSANNISIQLKNSTHSWNFNSKNWDANLNAWYNIDTYNSTNYSWAKVANLPVAADFSKMKDYYLYAKAVDIANNSNTTMHVFQVIPVPVITLNSPPEHSWFRQNFTMSINDTDATNCSYQISNGAGFSLQQIRACSSPLIITVGSGMNCTAQGADSCTIRLMANNTLYNTILDVKYSIDYTNTTSSISQPNSGIIYPPTMVSGTSQGTNSNVTQVMLHLYNSTHYYTGSGWQTAMAYFTPVITPNASVNWNHSVSGFSSGSTYTLNVTATDQALNNQTPATRTFTTDSLPPTCTLAGMPESSVWAYSAGGLLYYNNKGSGSFGVSVSAVDQTNGLTIKFPVITSNGASYSSTSNTFTQTHTYNFNTSSTTSGSFFANCSDSVGNTASASFNVSIDNTNPEASIEPDTPKIEVPANIIITCSDNQSGCYKIYYNISSGECPVFSTQDYVEVLSGTPFLVANNGTLCYIVFDNVNNNVTGTKTLVSPLMAVVITNPRDNENVCGDSAGNLLVEAIVPSQAENVTFSDNGIVFASVEPTSDVHYASAILNNASAMANGGVNDNIHIIKVDAFNYSGLMASDSVTVNYDCVPPAVELNPAYISNYDNLSGTVRIQAMGVSDDVQSVFFEYVQHPYSYNPLYLPIGYGSKELNGVYNILWQTSTVPDGSDYAVIAVATDDMGYKAFDYVFNITIDNTPPVIVNVSPKTGSTIWGDTALLNMSVYDLTTGINLSSARISFDNQNWVMMNCTGSSSAVCSINWNLSNLVDGYYIITYSVKDNLGNEASYQAIYKFVKNPVVLLTYPTSQAIIKGSIIATATAPPEASSVIFSYSTDKGSTYNKFGVDNNPLDGFSALLNTSLMSNGDYWFKAAAYDSLGTLIADDVNINIIVDNEKPLVLVNSSTHPNQSAWYESKQVNLSWIGVDAYSGIYAYSYVLDKNDSTIPDDIPEGELGNFNNTLEKTFDLSDGEWYFHIKAIDNAGNIGETTHFKINIDTITAPPNITIIKPLQLTVSNTPEIVIQTNKPCVCNFTQLYPEEGVYYNKTFNFTITNGITHSVNLILGYGYYTLHYECADFRGQTAEREHSFRVDPDAVPDELVIITAVENETYYANQVMNVEVAAYYNGYPMEGLGNSVVAILDGVRVSTDTTEEGSGLYMMKFRAPSNSSVNHTIAAYAKGVYSDIRFFSVKEQLLTVEYLLPATNKLENIVYVSDKDYILGFGAEPPNFVESSGSSFRMIVNPAEAASFIFFTLPYANMFEKDVQLSSGEFLSQIRPSFGLGKKDSQSLIMETTHPSIKISGREAVGPGRYSLVVRNVGKLDDGRVILDVEII